MSQHAVTIAHTLYTGTSLTGKTTLARIVARQLATGGMKGAVFDPVLSPTMGGGWPESWPLFTDADDYLDWIESDACQGPIHLFTDEADQVFGHEMKWNFWLLSKGRHLHIYNHVITQRPTMVSPTVRGQCHRGYLFRLPQEDADTIGRDYGHSGVHKISLDRGDFVVLESGSSVIQHGNVFKLADGNP